MFDNNLNLNLDNYLPNIKKAFLQVFGDQYLDIIDTRLSDCRIIYYMNNKTLKDYYNFLINCKIKELKIEFYNEIGLSYDKYKTENSGIVNDETFNFITLNIRFNLEEDTNSSSPFATSMKKLINQYRDIYKKLSKELNEYKTSTSYLLKRRKQESLPKYKDITKNNKIIELIENRQIKVLYTLNNHGENDLTFIHILCHVISTNENNFIGIEDEPLSIIDNDNNLRKYELLNELLTDIYSNEARQYLHSNYIYICEDKDKCTKNDTNKNTSKELKDIIAPLLEIIPLELKRAYIENNISIVTNVIGEKNFQKINELINKEYILSTKTQLDINKYRKIKSEYDDELKRIYANINSSLTKKD